MLEYNIQQRILAKLSFYASQPEPLEFSEPLTGLRAYRFRVGDYRIVFQHDRDLIYILSIRRRDEAYR